MQSTALSLIIAIAPAFACDDAESDNPDQFLPAPVDSENLPDAVDARQTSLSPDGAAIAIVGRFYTSRDREYGLFVWHSLRTRDC